MKTIKLLGAAVFLFFSFTALSCGQAKNADPFADSPEPKQFSTTAFIGVEPLDGWNPESLRKERWPKITAPTTFNHHFNEPTNVWRVDGGYFASFYAGEFGAGRRRNHSGKFNYPIGSIFTKRKYSHENATRPDIATRMEKTSKSGTIQDWNFTIVSLPNNKPIKTAADCAGCHKRFKSRGFISRVSEQAIQVILNPINVEQKVAEQPAIRL